MDKLNKNPDRESEATKREKPLTNPATDQDIQRMYKEAYKNGFSDGFDKANDLLEVENDDEPLSEDNE